MKILILLLFTYALPASLLIGKIILTKKEMRDERARKLAEILKNKRL